MWHAQHAGNIWQGSENDSNQRVTEFCTPSFSRICVFNDVRVCVFLCHDNFFGSCVQHVDGAETKRWSTDILRWPLQGVADTMVLPHVCHLRGLNGVRVCFTDKHSRMYIHISMCIHPYQVEMKFLTSNKEPSVCQVKRGSSQVSCHAQ